MTELIRELRAEIADLKAQNRAAIALLRKSAQRQRALSRSLDAVIPLAFYPRAPLYALSGRN